MSDFFSEERNKNRSPRSATRKKGKAGKSRVRGGDRTHHWNDEDDDPRDGGSPSPSYGGGSDGDSDSGD